MRPQTTGRRCAAGRIVGSRSLRKSPRTQTRTGVIRRPLPTKEARRARACPSSHHPCGLRLLRRRPAGRLLPRLRLPSGCRGHEDDHAPRLRRLAPHPREPRDLRRQEHGGLVHPHRVEHDDGDCPRGAVRLPRAPEAILRRKHRRPRACRFPSNRRPSSSPGGVAVISARGQGVYAVRLSDGLFGFLGPDGGGFAPRFDARGGVFFHDGESKLGPAPGPDGRRAPDGRRSRGDDRTHRASPLVTGGPIRSLSMDGPRVALPVGDTSGRCDRVLYWNVAWNPAQRVSAPSGPTCLVRPQGGRDPLGRDRRLPRRVARHPERHVTR